ncbi:DUF5916 domain-containing protein [Fulvivirga lutimaris]|uniref:DUF5916 domain-containing protein n=1 Tax=Fulvivirga lutimaris TaxID=1819566 RepID=UPI0012BCCBEC|nr:DUF5916 domain-containing protein [Fulvivirga lutimaris]MTI39648.1 hypothetical protein [Fulvivirga lutimaris]
MRKILFIATAFQFFAGVLLGQVNTDKYKLNISQATEPIVIDGELTESTWSTADKADNFITLFPQDSLPATSQTVVMMTYDNANLYIAGICYVDSKKRHVVQSLKRDFGFSRNDNVSIYLGTFNDFTNGFTFGVTPLGIQREGLVTNGQNVSTDWDNKWFSEVIDYGDRWEFEMKIPFKTIRYNEKADEWNIIFLRKDVKNNEESTWAPVPQGYRPSSFAFAGQAVFDKKLKKAGPNVAVIPFVSAASSKNFEEGTATENDAQVGFDAKIGLSSSLNLDLTVNPDFSQVEVDRQVTNLSRFEIFFPERRQFFLENKDLFDQQGFGESRPFFSRRIGIGSDTAGNAQQIPILYGARLSGNIGRDWRVGILNMQTKGSDVGRLTGVDELDNTYKLLPQNYSVGVIRRRIFGRSNIGITAVNRQAVGFDEDENISSTTAYNRVVGIDYNLLSDDSKWEGDFFYYRSFDEDQKDDAYASGMFLGYNTRNVRLRGKVGAVGEGYNAETGFVQRKDIIQLETFNDYNFYPENSRIVRHGPGMDFRYYTNSDFEKTDMRYGIDYSVTYLNTSNFSVRYSSDYVKLRSEFDPTRQLPDSLEFQKLQIGEEFEWSGFSIRYESDARKKFSYEVRYNDGGFYNGNRRNIRGEVNYRFQPFGLVTLSVDYNDLYNFPEPFADTNFWLIGPRFDITFTDKLFLTTFVQYNEQADNMNLNARFQWRFKPVSDLFVVYAENYFPQDFGVKSRALVLKMTYWLNI